MKVTTMADQKTRWRVAWDKHIEEGVQSITAHFERVYEQQLQGVLFPRPAVTWGGDTSLPYVVQAATRQLQHDLKTIPDSTWAQWFADYRAVEAHKQVTISAADQDTLRDLSRTLAEKYPDGAKFWVRNGEPNIQIVTYCAIRHAAEVAGAK